MSAPNSVVRRTKYCALCNQPMFDFYRSPDGHFGFVDQVKVQPSARGLKVRCSTCGARYRLLDRVDSTGDPVARC